LNGLMMASIFFIHVSSAAEGAAPY
jgi:hypothetical protein